MDYNKLESQYCGKCHKQYLNTLKEKLAGNNGCPWCLSKSNFKKMNDTLISDDITDIEPDDTTSGVIGWPTTSS